ncbi:MAG: peptidoglycan DD-metalloendopeptidase family protein [Candidatus Competibacteraceae bacterium]
MGTKMLLSAWIGLALAATVPAATMEQSVRTMDSPARDRQADSSKNWRWPIQGQVVLGYNPALPGRKGIVIGGKPRQAVRAAMAGRVVYAGGGLPHDGKLIIIKHGNNLLSAYGHLGKILVKQGEIIQSGQIIAQLGAGKTSPVLHFEIRRNGKPVNPLNFLPARRITAEA